MRNKNYLKTIALLMAILIVMLPVTIAEELNLIYDANGNLVSGDGFIREYDGFNQLVRVKNDSGNILEEFVWHPTDEKILIKKIYNSSGDVAQRIVYVNENTIKIKNSSGTFYEHYVYQDNILVAQRDTDGNKQFIHTDHEGSNTLITDINGNVVENTFYSPFGEIISGGKSSRFDGEGKEFDSLTQDYDFHFRKYRPDWGRFTQPDTLIQNVYDPQSLNRYSFERNNPYGRVDPTGHIWQYLVEGIIGALIMWGIGLAIRSIPALISSAVRDIVISLDQKFSERKTDGKTKSEAPKPVGPQDVLAASDKYSDKTNLANMASTQPIDKDITQQIKIEVKKEELEISDEDLKKIKPPEGTTIQLEQPKININEKDNVDGSGSSKNGGRMSYEERLKRHKDLARESNRKERRCKKTC